MEPTAVDWSTLAFAGIAALAATPVAAWAWTDRPQYGWTFRTGWPSTQEVPIKGGVAIRPNDRTQPEKVKVELHAIGTATVIDIRLRFDGCQPLSRGDVLHAGRMDNGSPPLSTVVLLPAAGAGPAWVEVTWRRQRPRVKRGERMELRTGAHQKWRWRWKSLRPRRVTGRRWRFRLVRTSGKWVPAGGPPIPEIPEPSPSTTG